MARYAVIETASGLVKNIIEWDGQTPYTPPDLCALQFDNGSARIGGTFTSGQFTPPPGGG